VLWAADNVCALGELPGPSTSDIRGLKAEEVI
jgi:hypothetical protein